MSPDRLRADTPASSSSWLHQIASSFEDAWQAGVPPQIGDYLPDALILREGRLPGGSVRLIDKDRA
jgi:hypothetical protein